MGKEGLHFISGQQSGDHPLDNGHIDMPVIGNEEEDEMLKKAIAMSLEEHPRAEKEEESEEEMLARALALGLRIISLMQE